MNAKAFWAAANIKDYLADPEDWGPAIQQGVNDLAATRGGAIYFPPGRYPIKSPVLIDVAGVRLIGVGGPGTDACLLEWQGGDDAMFVLSGAAEKAVASAPFQVRGLRMRARPKGGVAFRFANREAYTTRFHFSWCGVAYFRKVFEVGGPKLWGGLVVLDSRLSYNGQVVDATDGSLNEWSFVRCDIEKNGLASEGWEPTYAFDLVGSETGSIRDCNLEQQPRVLRAERSQVIVLDRPRFEGNAGMEDSTDPVCLFDRCNGVSVRSAFHRVLRAEDRPDVSPTVSLWNCHDYHVDPMLGRVDVRRGWEPRF